MRRSIVIALLLVVGFPLSSLSNTTIYAVEGCESATGQKLVECISYYESKINEATGQIKTLSEAIKQFDIKIRLAQLRIIETQEKIDTLEGRIDELTVSLDSLSAALKTRAVETYKVVRMRDPVSFVLVGGASSALSRFTYLERILDEDKRIMDRLSVSQDKYKVDKSTQEELSAKLTSEKAGLVREQTAKNQLLAQTKNSEARYEQFLAQALAEKAAIEAALVNATKVGPVKKGDPIALVGNSGYPGCSTGKHLHFEVRRDGVWVDPGGYLSNKSVTDDQNGGTFTTGSGNWDWPVSDPIRMTQHFGKTPYSWRYSYSGGIHTGFDMVPASSDVIRAPADGTLYRSAQKCGASSVINIAYIDHGGAVLSFYLHVQ